jgi:hypothetical protein
MSSLLRYIAQAPAHSPARAKFFLALVDISCGSGETTAGASVVYPDGDGIVQTVMTETEFNDAFSRGVNIGCFNEDAPITQIAQHALLRDMGREVVVTQDASPSLHLYKYRQVQIVNGSDTEGVPTTDVGPYVLVWAADGANVNVVRTG